MYKNKYRISHHFDQLYAMMSPLIKSIKVAIFILATNISILKIL